MLLAFARAERSSLYDMMEAANSTSDIGRKAQYLAHAVDEARHAKMFTLRARARSSMRHPRLALSV